VEKIKSDRFVLEKMRTFNLIIGSAFCNLACVRDLPDQVSSDFDNPPALFKEKIKIFGINIHYDF
jgi:hypothetical protein